MARVKAQRSSRRRLGIAAAALLAFGAVACGGNPNEDIDADLFIRPATSSVQETEGPEGTDGTIGQDGGRGERGNGDSADADAEPSTTDLVPIEDEIDLAEDIVRRYLNEVYGYSFELVCDPFCNVSSAGIDRVGFLTDDGQALINIAARGAEGTAPPNFAALEEIWRSQTVGAAAIAIVGRDEKLLPSDGVSPALQLDWEIDRRATGGFQERWRTLISQIGPIVYFINAGSVADVFADVELALQQSLDSFIARQDPPSVPGTYSRWEFRLPYDVDSFNGELGLLSSLPNFDSGVFLQQSAGGRPELVLTWEIESEESFDPAATIDTILSNTVGDGIEEVARGEFALGAEELTGRFALTRAQDATGDEQEIGLFAWYCPSSGRSFILQSFSVEDAQARAQPSLDDFRCLAP